MTTNNRTEPGVCTRCGDTRLIPIGDGYSVNPCPNCTGQQPAQLLAKHQPCGCIVCTCADDVRCHGCGARHCGTHPVSEIPNAVYEQPGSGELAKPVQRYRIRHLIDGDNVLDWPRDLRKGPDVVLASDYDRLQAALTAAQQRIAALEGDSK